MTLDRPLPRATLEDMTATAISFESLLKIRKGAADVIDVPESGFAVVAGSGAPGGSEFTEALRRPPSSSSTPSATVPASPVTTPAPTRTPGPGTTSPAPSIRVVSSRVTYPWHWPNDVTRHASVTHSYPAAPMPELVQISVGYHPGEHGQLAYNRMSFTFTTAFPSYHFEWVSQLAGDASGKAIPVAGTDGLKIVFDQARRIALTGPGPRSSLSRAGPSATRP